MTRGLVAPSFDVPPARIGSSADHDVFLISLYSLADIYILGSTVPSFLDLADVRTLVFSLSIPASTIF